MGLISLISSRHSIQMQKNTPSYQVHMEHSPGQTTSWVTNQTSVNLRKLKLCQASSLTTALRLGINYKKKTVRKTNTWRLNNTFINNQQLPEEIKREIKEFMETNDSDIMTAQNLQNIAKAVLTEKLIAIQYYLKRKEKKLNRHSNFTPETTGRTTTTTTTKQTLKLVEEKKS